VKKKKGRDRGHRLTGGVGDNAVVGGPVKTVVEPRTFL